MKNQGKANEKKESIFETKRCHELLFVCGLIVLAIGCGTLYAMMETNWALNSAIRERVLCVAGFLFVASFALCYYIIKAEQKRRESEFRLGEHTELICLTIDRPPSYESVREQPPPSYQAVVTGAYIVPCHRL